jgi:hypothetical protein
MDKLGSSYPVYHGDPLDPKFNPLGPPPEDPSGAPIGRFPVFPPVGGGEAGPCPVPPRWPTIDPGFDDGVDF